ncbi:MAG: Ni/Fe hydrogenase subunit alpha [Limnochordaceae bacterium]|nr:Ni/Fe hydrogenase subunit alpha [Limnochordaceae bacterium]
MNEAQSEAGLASTAPGSGSQPQQPQQRQERLQSQPQLQPEQGQHQQPAQAQRLVQVEYMARVEGEASLHVKIEDSRLQELVLDVFEAPRFFQGFLVGRAYTDVPELVSRICGICPASHQLTALAALETALGVEVSEEVRLLRRLLAVAQIFQSHVLHVCLLALPDYLHYPSVLEMAQRAELRPAVERALRLKKLANDLTAWVGGRAVHPVTAVIGGFTSVPDRQEGEALRERLAAAEEDVWVLLRLVATLCLPQLVRDEVEFVALVHEQEYPVNEGELRSSRGLVARPATYRAVIEERHVPPSHALHSYVRGRDTLFVGPLARMNLNWHHLPAEVRQAAEEMGWEFPDGNTFASIRARALEILFAWLESRRLLDEVLSWLNSPSQVERKVRPPRVAGRAGEGAALTEAPRGLLYHCYRLDRQGRVESADIVSPTAHNVANMQRDLEAYVPALLDRSDEEIALQCEMLVRSYDPCFSCSAHFLKVQIDRK